MDKIVLQKLIEDGLSQRQIAKQLEVSQTSVKYWLRKHDINTKHLQFNKKIGNDGRCKICGEDDIKNFYKSAKHGFMYWCKKCHNKYAVARFRKYKLQAIEYKGGKCVKCGYKNCPAAFDFHHRDPNQKDPNWHKMRNWKFDKIKEELDKCDLVCRNCHSEIHYGLESQNLC